MEHDQTSSSRRAWRTDEAWARLRERIAIGESDRGLLGPPPVDFSVRRFPGWTRRIALAAALVIVAVGLTLYARARLTSAAITRTVSTGAGERLSIRLADSSVVTVGPLSRLRFELAPTRRVVELSGIASFRVTHDSTRPFVVRAQHASVQDLGTEFVVRAYEDDSSVAVSVSSGVVSLARIGSSAGVVRLEAGMVGTLPQEGDAVVGSRSDPSTFAAWIEGGLSFDDASLADVARELRHWFGVDVRVSDSALAKRRVMGVYADPTLTGVLDALATTLGKDVRWRRSADGRTITIQRGR